MNKFNATRALSKADKQLEVMQIGNARLLMETTGPESMYYNRIKGFGASDLDKLDDILQEYEKRKLVPCFDITPDCLNEEVARGLHGKGYMCSEQLAFLEATPMELPLKNERITIRQVTEENVYELLNTISHSMGGISADILERKKSYFVLPHFVNYLAYIDDKIAGMASLFIHEQAGYLANDFTIPDFRGQGCQKALICHRISEAKRMGLSVLYTDVEFGSSSYDNMLNLGFRNVFTSSFWIKA